MFLQEYTSGVQRNRIEFLLGPTLKGSHMFCGVCDGTFMRPLQGRMERVSGLPWAGLRLPAATVGQPYRLNGPGRSCCGIVSSKGCATRRHRDGRFNNGGCNFADRALPDGTSSTRLMSG